MTAGAGTVRFEEAARVTVVPYAGGRIALCTTTIAAPEGLGARARDRRHAEHAAGQHALITSLAALGVHTGPPGRRPDGSPGHRPTLWYPSATASPMPWPLRGRHMTGLPGTAGSSA